MIFAVLTLLLQTATAAPSPTPAPRPLLYRYVYGELMPSAQVNACYATKAEAAACKEEEGDDCRVMSPPGSWGLTYDIPDGPCQGVAHEKLPHDLGVQIQKPKIPRCQCSCSDDYEQAFAAIEAKRAAWELWVDMCSRVP